jgi:hypothetical protein
VDTQAREPVRARFARLRPVELAAFVELLGAASIAITQPFLDLLRKNADVFIAHQSGSVEVLVLTALIVLVPALALWALEFFVSLRRPKVRPVVHAVFLGALLGLFVMEFLKQATEFERTALIVAGIAGFVVWTVLALKAVAVRNVLRILSVASVFFVVTFLFSSPINSFLGSSPNLLGVTVESPKRVVMVMLDEFPTETLLDGNGRIDRELYPNFAAFADTSTWYRNHTSVGPFTEWAVPAMMSGRYPRNIDDVPLAFDYPDTLFRLLGGSYRMNVHEQVTYLCPTNICTGKQRRDPLVQRVAKLTGSATDLYSEFASPSRPAPPTFAGFLDLAPQLSIARRYIRSLEASEKPTFDFVHLLLPHLPWRYLPTLQDVGYSKEDPFRRANSLVWGTEGSAAIGHARHVLQTQALDKLLGEMVARLKEIGAWDNSIVVLTSDHGEAFVNQLPMRSVTEATADQIVWTPLLIKTPGQRDGVVDDRPAEAIDVIPTIADLIDVEIPWEVDGVSLLGAPRPEFVRRFYQWEVKDFTPPGYPAAKSGEYLSFDPRVYFPKVLRTRVTPRGGDPALRPYRMIGPYGDLIGRDPAPLVDPNAPGPSKFFLPPHVLAPIDPAGKDASWTWIEQHMIGVSEPGWVAFGVNGRIGGLGYLSKYEGRTEGFYYGVLAPQFFREGVNKIEAFKPSGPPGNPVLKPIPYSP